jgi:hypothetical protein
MNPKARLAGVATGTLRAGPKACPQQCIYIGNANLMNQVTKYNLINSMLPKQ